MLEFCKTSDEMNLVMVSRLARILLIVCGLSFGLAEAQSVIAIADFENGDLQSWEGRSFKGTTDYQIISLGTEQVLQASSKDTASGLAIKVRVDLKATPYLNWRWQVIEKLTEQNERTKHGDDYAARVYVVIDGGFQFWKTMATNYVWSSQQSVGTTQDNAYSTKNAQMLDLQDDDSPLTWHTEKRNVYQDFIRLFGDKGSEQANEKAYRYIDAIAIMTDTDDSGGKAKAYYDDIFFSAE